MTISAGGRIVNVVGRDRGRVVALDASHADAAAEIHEVVSLKLALVGLAGFEEFYPSEISGGMQKRAGLARAMALDPDILFFDEPSAGLSPVLQRLIFDRIRDINTRGVGIVLVEQNARESLKLCRRGYLLVMGQTRAEALAARDGLDPGPEGLGEIAAGGQSQGNDRGGHGGDADLGPQHPGQDQGRQFHAERSSAA